MRKYSVLTKGGLALVMLVLGSKLGLGAIAFTNGTAGKLLIPVGAQQVVVYSFTLTAQTDNESLTRVTVQNIGAGTVRFGAGINNVSIFLDANNDGILSADEAQTPLGSKVPDSDTATITLSSAIANGTSKTYLVAYDLNATAAIGQVGNVTLKADGLLNAAAGQINMGVVQASNFTVTGFSTATAVSIAPGVVVPDQVKIAMLRLSLQSTGENVDTLEFTVANESANFVDKNGSLNGVTAAHLYLDANANATFESATDTLLQTVEGTNLTTADSVTFTSTRFSANLTLAAGTARTLYIVYDLGENTTVTKDSAISAKITGIRGAGATSRLPVSLQTSTPVTPAQAFVSGIAIGTLTGINTGTSFGAGSSAGILKMRLRAQNGSVTMNQITIQNSGTIKYVTDTLSNRGITRINIYDDNFKNETLDPEKGDRKIGTLRLGNGAGQTDTQAPVNIVVPGSTDGLNIPTYNPIIDNATTVFVEYVIGTDVTSAKDASGNATSMATAELVAVSASSNVSRALVSLTGSLPAVATPPARLSVGETNLIINDVTILAPADAFTGQVQVPMLGFSLTAAQSLSSANIRVRNTNSTYSSFGQGVTKIWLYEDSGATVGALDNGDKFIAATTQFESSSLATLGPISIPQKTVQYLLLYDIGLTASSVGAAAQIDNIVPTGSGTAITFIGLKPIPTSPAVSTINTLALTVNKVALSSSTVTDQTVALGVEVGIKNNSARNLSITQASPRFFKNNAYGEDTTYSFAITPVDTYPLAIAAGASVTLSFTANASNLVFDGTLAVDAALTAQVNNATTIMVQRFKTSATTWQSASTTVAQITASSSTEDYDWDIPRVVQSMAIQRGSTDIPFLNRDAVPAHSQLKIQLAESGRGIDPASMILIRKGRAGNQTMILNTDYTYGVDTGLITIQDVGNSNVIFALGFTDKNRNPLPVANIWVTVSNDLKISEFYAFPNPYVPNGSNMTFGFNATQPGTGVISILNSRGQKVAEKSFDISTLGYQKITWDGRRTDGNIIFSGIYYVVITATDSNGNKTYANTRLAIY